MDLFEAVHVFGRKEAVALGIPLRFQVFREGIGPESHKGCALPKDLRGLADSVVQLIHVIVY